MMEIVYGISYLWNRVTLSYREWRARKNKLKRLRELDSHIYK